MKLYVWESPYQVSYGHSVVFAIAESLSEAKEVAARGKTYSFGYEQDPQQYGDDWRAPIAEALGDPDRVVELPAAEWHRWEE